MKVYGDIEAINLGNGERFQRVSGDGESRLIPVRHHCPNCHYASDTLTVCPALCCNGQKMLPRPDALLDSEIFTSESWVNQCEAERENK